ncbi:hypothetical protein KIN20_024644 [Parelaphostrongylus tenuis]|uniref:Uncharacterized protein n=1 Tax=Parelaphostrongylus tenuis TaxID=148309 RepID=A0AAD5MX90_PARTN|nr:hypothetical protein KIN20_024644 [Parelaphostrongylus tenuis]
MKNVKCEVNPKRPMTNQLATTQLSQAMFVITVSFEITTQPSGYRASPKKVLHLVGLPLKKIRLEQQGGEEPQRGQTVEGNWLL